MVKFAGRSHPGFRGGENEDHIGWSNPARRFVVADGMGAHANGKLASQIVCNTLVGSGARRQLEQAVCAAHAAVVAATTAGSNMGSTVVAAELEVGRCLVVWVGDSRAYRWRSGLLERLTKDHSVAEMLQEQEGLTEQEAKTRPDQGPTQALGMGVPIPSVVTTRLGRHEWILLCSDGLTSMLEDSAIASVLRNSESTDEAADALISATLVAGATDNVSVVVIDSGPGSGWLTDLWHQLMDRLSVPSRSTENAIRTRRLAHRLPGR